MMKHKRNTLVAYLLFFFFGGLGLHQLYLLNFKRTMVYLGALPVLWAMLMMCFTVGFGWADETIAVALLLIFWAGIIVISLYLAYCYLRDLFTLGKQVREFNEKFADYS